METVQQNGRFTLFSSKFHSMNILFSVSAVYSHTFVLYNFSGPGTYFYIKKAFLKIISLFIFSKSILRQPAMHPKFILA